MGSSRLPGKVLKSVTNTTSVLQFQLEQLLLRLDGNNEYLLDSIADFGLNQYHAK